MYVTRRVIILHLWSPGNGVGIYHRKDEGMDAPLLTPVSLPASIIRAALCCQDPRITLPDDGSILSLFDGNVLMQLSGFP